MRREILYLGLSVFVIAGLTSVIVATSPAVDPSSPSTNSTRGSPGPAGPPGVNGTLASHFVQVVKQYGVPGPDLPLGTLLAVNFSASAIDTDGYRLSNSKLIIPENLEGWYMVGWNLAVTTPGTTDRVDVYLKDGANKNVVTVTSTVANVGIITTSQLVYLDAGQNLTLVARVTSSTGTTWNSPDTIESQTLWLMKLK